MPHKDRKVRLKRGARKGQTGVITRHTNSHFWIAIDGYPDEYVAAPGDFDYID